MLDLKKNVASREMYIFNRKIEESHKEWENNNNKQKNNTQNDKLGHLLSLSWNLLSSLVVWCEKLVSIWKTAKAALKI